MVNWYRLLALSFLQGFAEFLPVSSSGHLALLGHIFRLGEDQSAWTIVLHAGTLLSIIVFFWKDLIKILLSLLTPGRLPENDAAAGRRLFLSIVLGTLPAALVGFIFYKKIEDLFQDFRLVLFALAVNGLWLVVSERISLRRKEKKSLGFKEAFYIGLAQALALIPGISRSGATIGAGLSLGLGKEESFSFAFLLAIPATLGAIIISRGELSVSFLVLTAVILFTGLIGYATLLFLSVMVKKSRLYYFACYCWFISGVGMLTLK